MCAASPMTSSACSYTKTRDGVSTIHKDAIGYYEFFAKVSDDTTVDATKKVADALKIETHYDAYQTDRSTDLTVFLEGQRRLKSKEKNKVLGEEMAVDYSDVDENNKIKCLACIPDQQNKESLWNQYVKKENMTQEQFSYSSSCFYNNSNKG